MKIESIAQQLLFTTTKIDTADESSNIFVATGFFFHYVRNKLIKDFLVTNRHVVEGKREAKLSFIQKDVDNQPIFGILFEQTFNNFEEIWTFHPEDYIDVAITPLSPIIQFAEQTGKKIFFKSVGPDIVPSAEDLKQSDAIEEIVFVGYPYGLWDSSNLLPIVRKGITATPIVIDFRGKKQFLIDASVFPGSSGSPVFLYDPHSFPKRPIAMFLGMISATYQTDIWNEIKIEPTLNRLLSLSREYHHLGVVYKASAIIETIEAYFKTI